MEPYSYHDCIHLPRRVEFFTELNDNKALFFDPRLFVSFSNQLCCLQFSQSPSRIRFDLKINFHKALAPILETKVEPLCHNFCKGFLYLLDDIFHIFQDSSGFSLEEEDSIQLEDIRGICYICYVFRCNQDICIPHDAESLMEIYISAQLAKFTCGYSLVFQRRANVVSQPGSPANLDQNDEWNLDCYINSGSHDLSSIGLRIFTLQMVSPFHEVLTTIIWFFQSFWSI